MNFLYEIEKGIIARDEHYLNSNALTLKAI